MSFRLLQNVSKDLNVSKYIADQILKEYCKIGSNIKGIPDQIYNF